jgi:hypothetical protein
MARDDDAMSSEIHASITIVVTRITKRNASTKPRSEFMGHSGGGVWIAKTTKNTKRRVVEVHVMEGKIWRGITNCFGGKAIKGMSGVMKSFDPQTRW